MNPEPRLLAMWRRESTAKAGLRVGFRQSLSKWSAERRGKPVSRILFPGSSRIDDHSSCGPVARNALAANPDLLGQKQPCLATRDPYLALLPVGLAVPPLLPAARWALTPPFHPYPGVCSAGALGGLISVALSVGLPRPGVTRHRCFLESGLSSPARHALRQRPSGFPRVTGDGDKYKPRQALREREPPAGVYLAK